MSEFAKLGLSLLALAYSLTTWAQDASPASVPARMIITVGHHYSQVTRSLSKEDLVISQRYEPLPVTDVIPLRENHAAMDLILLVDHCSNCEPGSKFEELSRFITSQPAATRIGVAYIQNGKLQVAQEPSIEHGRAVKALTTPEGSKPSSPFGALAELIHSWPKGACCQADRRIVVMVSNGINPAATDKLQDESAEAALKEAQRTGVTVYVVYHPSADYLTTDSSKLYSGQVQLAHVADESGGEAYFLGFGPLPSLAPFLADLSDHLANQYLVEFLVKPSENTGGLEPIAVKSKISGLDVMAPEKVWVPGSASGGRSPYVTEQEHQ